MLRRKRCQEQGGLTVNASCPISLKKLIFPPSLTSVFEFQICFSPMLSQSWRNVGDLRSQDYIEFYLNSATGLSKCLCSWKRFSTSTSQLSNANINSVHLTTLMLQAEFGTCTQNRILRSRNKKRK